MPFRSRLVQLMQRSRKALRLYSSVEKLSNESTSDLAELQVGEWRRVNAQLLKDLALALEQPNQKRMVSEVFGIRDQFYGEWKMAEADLNQKQRQLLDCAENSDFIKASILSRELVSLKARSQACQAAHHEVQEAIHKGRVSQPDTDDVCPAQALDDAPVERQREAHEEIRVAKVIPLRKSARNGQ